MESSQQKCPICSLSFAGVECAGCGYSATRCPICNKVVFTLEETSGEAALCCHLAQALDPCECMVAWGAEDLENGCEWLDPAFEAYCRKHITAAYADVDDEKFQEMSGGRTRNDYCRDVDVLRNVLPDVPWLKIAAFKTTDRMSPEVQHTPTVMFFVAPGDRQRLKE